MAAINEAFVDAYGIAPENVQVFIHEVAHETGRRKAFSRPIGQASLRRKTVLGSTSLNRTSAGIVGTAHAGEL